MKIQKILSVMIIVVMLLGISTTIFATNEEKEEVVGTTKTSTEVEEEVSTKEEKKSTEDENQGKVGEPAKSTDLEAGSGDGVTSEPDGEEGDGDGTDEVVWTDFSKAKFELKKDGTSNAILEISNVTPKAHRTYYLYLADNSTKPNVDTLGSSEKLSLMYDEETGTMVATDTKIRSSIELNKDMYASVIEVDQDTFEDNVVVSGKKLTKYAEPKYSDAFFATFMTYKSDQIVTNFTHARENNRKIQIKIGKITDTAILQKIKSQDSSGFANLLSYAKSNSGIYNQTLNADKDSSSIEYNAGDHAENGNAAIDLKNLENSSYYYLYVSADDEDGKYIPVEAVTLAVSDVIDNEAWYMFFYGSDDFEWADFGNSPDGTTAPGTIPQTGETTIVIATISIISVLGVAGYINYKKYKDVK